MIEAIVQDEDEFEKLFNEGLKESEAIEKDIMGNTDQERIFNTKQLIFVGSRQFEFT